MGDKTQSARERIQRRTLFRYFHLESPNSIYVVTTGVVSKGKFFRKDRMICLSEGPEWIKAALNVFLVLGLWYKLTYQFEKPIIWRIHGIHATIASVTQFSVNLLTRRVNELTKL